MIGDFLQGHGSISSHPLFNDIPFFIVEAGEGLANFSLAVNRQSEPGVVEFYGATFPVVTWLIRANEVHTQLVRTLAQTHPEVCLVDTHPHLDGVHEKFVDLAHLTQAGRQQLAENIFAGIRSTLEADLSRNE